MKLYFLRHGLADRAEWDGDDFERPLTEKGKARMAREADTLAKLGLEVDLILSSPLTRARQTAEIVARRLGLADRLQIDERLSPGFALGALAKILEAQAKRQALLLVGHEPDFSETIGALIGGGQVLCKKGALARVDLCPEHPPRGHLVWLIPPSVLVL
jgi:phosphohistidine phosphatase